MYTYISCRLTSVLKIRRLVIPLQPLETTFASLTQPGLQPCVGLLNTAGTAEHSMIPSKSEVHHHVRKLLDYWKRGRYAVIRGFVTPPSYNKKSRAGWMISSDGVPTRWGLGEYMSEFVTGPSVIGAEENPPSADQLLGMERNGGSLVKLSTQCFVFEWSLTARYG